MRARVRRGATIAAAFALDLVAGDPRWFPHPVRVIGAAIAWGEPFARRWSGPGARNETIAGGIFAAAIVSLTTLAVVPVQRRHAAFDVALAWMTLAVRDLLAEAGAVITAGERDDLALARTRLARIVGRETAQLDASEVARATIEALAESSCDGIVAPLLALALGGVPAAFAFKATSTLDSMIGHLEPPHRFFGSVAARFDDALCYVPARISAFAMCALAPLVDGSPRRAWRTLSADGHKHRSPNAGRPEAAMAGALGVRLGGTNVYDGVTHEGAVLGATFTPPDFADARRAQRLVLAVAFSATLVLTLATWNLDAA